MTPRALVYAVSGAVAAGAAGSALWVRRHVTAPAVRSWAPGAGQRVRTGTMSVRTFGTGEQAAVLLHGLGGTGDAFGSMYDELGQRARVLVPDLPGFGASMDSPGRTGLTSHEDALDEMLDRFGLSHHPLVVAGHSMGGSLALRWAARHAGQVRAVLTFGAPLYLDRAEADARLRSMGRIEAGLAGDRRVARATCDWMCRHRTAASWLTAGYRPDLPVRLARRGVEHTWASYAGAVDGLIRDGGWRPALARLAQGEVEVTLVEGTADPVPVPGRAAALAARLPSVHVAPRPGGHDLPLTDPIWCADAIAARLDRRGGGTRARREGLPPAQHDEGLMADASATAPLTR